MISSEVQRTLVKSPPELWAELSDPDALSRHLGALGEVRITRAEHEKLVEWEAEGTSGSVQIKPSAWGTKVTLCVTRELDVKPPPTPDPHVAEEAAATHVPGPAAPDEPAIEPPTGEADDRLPAESEELAIAEPEAPETIDAGDPVIAEPKAPETIEAGDPAFAEHEQPVVTDADEAVTADEDEPVVTDADEAVTADADEAVTAEADEQRTIAFTAIAEPEIAADSRRGFFARLFGRLLARSEDSSQRLPAEATQPLDWEPNTAPLSIEDSSPEPEVAEAESGPASSAIESLQARFATEDPSPAEPVEAIDVVSDQAIEPTGVEPQPGPEEPAAGPEPPPDPVAEDPPEPGAAPSANLAAELKAAEEVAAEEVTAVLTAVLDRLGAAHHRPFSRS